MMRDILGSSPAAEQSWGPQILAKIAREVSYHPKAGEQEFFACLHLARGGGEGEDRSKMHGASFGLLTVDGHSP